MCGSSRYVGKARKDKGVGILEAEEDDSNGCRSPEKIKQILETGEELESLILVKKMS